MAATGSAGYIAHTTNNVSQYVRALAKKAATTPYEQWAHISPDYEYGHNVWDYLRTADRRHPP